MNKLGVWLAQSVTVLGPGGLFLVALGDSAFIPLPQGVDALLIAQSIAAPETAWFAATLATAGSLIGSLILYGVARKGGRAVLARRVTAEGMQKMERRTEQWGALALIPPMMIPLPLPTKIFVIGAGVFQMSIARFSAATVFGRAIRYFGEAYVARLYGDQTTTFISENVGLAVGVGVVLVALFYAVNKWSTRKVATGA